MHQEIVMNHFISAILMGEEIFKFYEEKAKSPKLKKMIQDLSSSFETQRNFVKKKMEEKGYKSEEECSFLQKNAIVMEKIKTSAINTDFDLCINIIKSMNAATIGAMKYLYKGKENIEEDLMEVAKKTLQNYDNIVGKVKNYALKDFDSKKQNTSKKTTVKKQTKNKK